MIHSQSGSKSKIAVWTFKAKAIRNQTAGEMHICPSYKLLFSHLLNKTKRKNNSLPELNQKILKPFSCNFVRLAEVIIARKPFGVKRRLRFMNF